MSKKSGTGHGARLTYPVARRVDHVDTYFGTQVADPYRWMEEYGPELSAWIDAENALTRSYLDAIPGREALKKRLTQLWDYEKYGAPSKHGKRKFFYKNSGMQNQYVLYVIDEEGAEPRVLIDPNALSEDGTVALSSTAINEEGTLIAYGISASGSDWVEIRVRDIATGEDLPDVIKWVKFSGASWTKDGKGFYYGRFPEPQGDELKAKNINKKIYYHVVGTPQSEDRLVYERPDYPEWSLGGGETEDGKYFIIYVHDSSAGNNRIFYRDLTVENSPVVELLGKNDAKYSIIETEGSKWWIVTDLGAPRKRLILLDVAKSTPENLAITEVIPECGETLGGVSLLGDTFFAHYQKDACTVIRKHNIDGAYLGDVALPGIGSGGGFGGKRDEKETYYSFTTYTEPGTIYKYDVVTGESTVYFKPAMPFDSSKFETKRVFVMSKDGTKVPLFITHKKGLKRNGKNPTYLYGYGGFNISMGPSFSVNMAVFMEMGGVFAEACLRGGGEYGKEWHEAGTKLQKQNVFDDFIACAEWLIDNKYTSTPKLSINGGSNGGLLVGACETQRPELYGACSPAVGVLDMLRFHQFTIGRAWKSDYGCAEENEDEFRALYAYSPYHNVRPGTHYPPTYITCGDHDDRVFPAHSFKFAAAMQWAQAGDAPILIRIETKAGHGAGKPTTMLIEEMVDKLSFLAKQLKITPAKVTMLAK